MTTAIVHGDPGSRKTATLVGQYGIPALFSGRTVVTNIRGFDSIKRIEEVYGKKVPEGTELIAIPFNREGFRRMGNFFHWAPEGALILMDEIQRIYPVRLRNLSFYDANPPRPTPVEGEDIETVEEAFDCHRHMNWDIYCSTPNIAKCNKEIRQVAEFGYRQKDWGSVSGLLAFLLGDIKRVKHDAENSGKSESHSMGSTNHRINKKVFKTYQSTATGKAKGSHTSSNSLAQPKLICLGLFVLYSLYNTSDALLTYGTLFPTSTQIAAMDNEVSADQLASNSGLEGTTVSAYSDRGVSSDSVDNGGLDSSVLVGLIKSLVSYDGFMSVGGENIYLFTSRTGDSQPVSLTSSSFDELGITVKHYDGFASVSSSDYQRIVMVSAPEPILDARRIESRLSDFNYQ